MKTFDNYEKERAVFDANQSYWLDRFFDARPYLERNRMNEYLVENGFRLGWEASRDKIVIDKTNNQKGET